MNENLLYLGKVVIGACVLAYLWFFVSPYADRSVAIQAPVRLGGITALDFRTDRNEAYAVLVGLESPNALTDETDRLACLLGARPLRTERCEQSPLSLTWRILDADSTVAMGSGGRAGDTTISGGVTRNFGSFLARRGGNYKLEIEISHPPADLAKTIAIATVSAARDQPGAASSETRAFRTISHTLAAIAAGLAAAWALTRYAERHRRASVQVAPPAEAPPETIHAGASPAISSRSYLTGVGLIGLLMVAALNVFVLYWVALFAGFVMMGDSRKMALFFYGFLAIVIATSMASFVLLMVGRVRGAYALLILTTPTVLAILALLFGVMILLKV